MSVTQCRTCDQPITFVLRDDGRWRPVEVRYQELEAEGDEMIAIQKGGSWTQLTNKIRVYTTHSCLDDPSWNRGRPTMRDGVLVDTQTGEVIEEPEDDPDPELEWHDVRRQRRERMALRRCTPKGAPVVGCQGCGAEYGQPCVNEYGDPVVTACMVRKLTIAFDEDLGEHWPPRHNQAGYRQMQSWLHENHTLFALPAKEKA